MIHLFVERFHKMSGKYSRGRTWENFDSVQKKGDKEIAAISGNVEPMDNEDNESGHLAESHSVPDGELDQEEMQEVIGARPRRLSEIDKVKTKIKPIPEQTSLFILTKTNPLELDQLLSVSYVIAMQEWFTDCGDYVTNLSTIPTLETSPSFVSWSAAPCWPLKTPWTRIHPEIT